MVSWQLAPSLLMLQLSVLIVMYALGPAYLTRQRLSSFARCHAASALVASALLLGNPMTACSLYTCMAVSACAWSLLTVFEHPSSSRWRRWLRFIVLLVGPLASAVLLRFVLQRGLDIHDDDHLPNLLRAKWGTLADFHTSMYLRIEGYRALPLAVYWELTKTGLLPLAAGAALALSLQVAWDLVSAVDPHRPPPRPPQRCCTSGWPCSSRP
eukprot:TRINITY_DN9095_c0_g1_i1.p2 TRINITY_DN9095_c0_g1~~TRINITY_DN9095_c0_g1_i1.p2  ORF type:complete len:212 (+),score=39.09 TRINITY_DN9095_c0_g1_i1:125-760(+)